MKTYYNRGKIYKASCCLETELWPNLCNIRQLASPMFLPLTNCLLYLCHPLRARTGFLFVQCDLQLGFLNAATTQNYCNDSELCSTNHPNPSLYWYF